MLEKKIINFILYGCKKYLGAQKGPRVLGGRPWVRLLHTLEATTT
jgi:hypothetical protein